MRVHLNSAPCYHVGMPRKPKPPPDDPEQSKRFIDMVREVGAEQPSPNFERVFRKVAEQPKGHRIEEGDADPVGAACAYSSFILSRSAS
jgi:hypothetical protein